MNRPRPQEYRIDLELTRRLSPERTTDFRTVSRVLPGFRFVDLYRAVDTVLEDRTGVSRFATSQIEALQSILHSLPPAWSNRVMTWAPSVSWPVGPGEETLLPEDQFWVAPSSSGWYRVVVRLKYDAGNRSSLLEVAALEPEEGDALVEAVLAVSGRDSIYRNRTIDIAFRTSATGDYGDVEKLETFHVGFKPVETVADEDIVFDEDIRRILHRNVLDLHERRELLAELGVPARRGVLLYGPPGTGKTFACRYLAGKLVNVTRIVVTGSALMQVGQVFELARLLQPSVLFLEDVDLVFMDRQVNSFRSLLGDLLDQMDGLRPFEDIGFVLTTNAIENVEEAIRDRPGRISQCVRFGPPSPELRDRFLRRYLERYDWSRVDLDRLVGESEGVTQAFLKEWVHRSVQIASERIEAPGGELDLRTGDFDTALREMKAFSTGSTARIVGFRD